MTDDLLPRLAAQGERDRAAFTESVRARREARPPRPVTHKDLTDFETAVAEAMARFTAAVVRPLVKRIAALEARPELRHAGTWREGQTCSPGELVTDHGGLWLCERATSTRPGTSDHFRLVVKRGKAA